MAHSIPGVRWHSEVHRVVLKPGQGEQPDRDTRRTRVDLLSAVAKSESTQRDLSRRVDALEVSYVGVHGWSCLDAGELATVTDIRSREAVRRTTEDSQGRISAINHLQP